MPEVPNVPHDDSQPPPDELTHLAVNHVWRRFIGHILMDYADNHSFDATDAEIEQALDWLDALVADFYTPGAVGVDMEYHGVMAGRDTLLTIPTVGINVPYTDDAGGRLHDTDNYWSPTQRTQFIVPAGLGGWYAMNLYMLWAGGTGQPRVDIRNQVGAPIYAQEAINLQGLYTSWLSAVALLEDNAGVIVQAFSAIADRDIIVGGFEYSTTFHMYRIGAAAGT